MKKEKYYLSILLMAVIFAGCKKDSSNKTTPISGSSSYFPVTQGSSWVYNDAITNGATSTNTISMTGKTLVINGKTYYAALSISPTKGNDTTYYYAADHDYAIRGSNAAAGVTIELQAGNDAQPAGYTWTTIPSDNGTIGSLPAQTINTIVEKNITKTVNGKVYLNVIHTRANLQYNAGTGFLTVATYDIYLAKGIGLIEADSSIGGALYESETITSYTIK